MSILGSKDKMATFRLLSSCTYFLTGYLNTSWSVFLLSLHTDSGGRKKDAEKILGQNVIDQGQ